MTSPIVNFLRKDLRVTRIFWAPLGFSYGAFLLVFFPSRWVFLGAAVCLTFAVATVPMVIDDRYRTDPLFAGLPIRRAALVAGRYLSWAFAALAGLTLLLGTTFLLILALGPKAAHLAPVLTVRGATAFLLAFALGATVFIPCYFRFGFWKGVWVFAAGGLGLIIALSLAAPRLGVPAGRESAGGPAAGVLGPLAELFVRITGEADRFQATFLTWSLSAAALVALLFFSYRLSLAFYSRRDL